MLYTIVHFFTNKRCALSLYISAWAISALLVQTGWAMREPLSVGRVTGTDSRAFSFYMVNLNLSIVNRPVLGSLLEDLYLLWNFT